jgi:hypothetical protein
VTKPLIVGRLASSFTLKAIASGRTFNPADHKGKPVLLIFANHNTGRGTQSMVESVRRRHPQFERLPITLVIDARIEPRFFHVKLVIIGADGWVQAEYQGPQPAEKALELLAPLLGSH